MIKRGHLSIPSHSHPLSHHRHRVAPLHLPEAEDEPVPDRLRHLLFANRPPPERPVELPQYERRMDVDRLLSARGKQGIDDLAGKPLAPVLVERKDAVHLQAIFVAGAAGGRGKFSIDKGPEDAFGLWVGLLVPVVGPDLLGEGELGGGKFADGGGGGHTRIVLLVGGFGLGAGKR